MNSFTDKVNRTTCKISLFFIILSLIVLCIVEKSSAQFVVVVLTLIINICVVGFIILKTYIHNKIR